MFTVCEPVPVCVRVAQSAESHRLKELEQIKSHPATQSRSARPFISRDLNKAHTSDRMGLTVHTVIKSNVYKV